MVIVPNVKENGELVKLRFIGVMLPGLSLLRSFTLIPLVKPT